MTSQFRLFSPRAGLAAILVAGLGGSLLMTGCGLGVNAISTDAAPLAAGFSGKINGGPNPIAGATVSVWTTTSTGYGVGQFRQQAVAPSASDGSFHFAGGYSCPAGQFLYIQSAGGNTGAGENPKAFLFAALGRCEDLFSGGTFTHPYIYLNELTTVAGAYALGNFSTFSGTGSNTVLNIGAPARNNAAVGCVASGSICPLTQAAGLRHAFQNAMNLVNPFIKGTTNALAQNTFAIVPAQLLNSIANSLVSCVNSDGTGTSCQKVFAATGTNFATGNIAQVAVNLAKNPTLAGTGTSAQFYSAATPQSSFYQPILNSAPPDYSMVILTSKFAGVSGGRIQGIVYPTSSALDINDNIYIGNYNSSSRTISNAVSLKSDSTFVSITPNSTAIATGDGASVDAIGNLYLVGADTTVFDGQIARYTTDPVTGTITPTPATIAYGNAPLTSSAVDAANNLWFGSYDGFISELPAGGTAPVFTRSTTRTVGAVAVDPNQNIWLTIYAAAPNNAVNVVQNVGASASTPSYSQGGFLIIADAGDQASGVSFVQNAGNSSSPYIAYVSNASNAPGITYFTPFVTPPTVTSVVEGSQVTTGTSSPSNNQTDGDGNIWTADGPNIVKLTPGNTAATPIAPCRIRSTAATLCTINPYSGIQSVSIDSAGSIWFLSTGNGFVGEIIGSAAPTWPLLPLTTFGRPQ